MTQRTSSTSSSKWAGPVKAVVFLLGVLLLLQAVQFVVFPRHDRDELWSDYLGLPAHSVDALFLGTSLVHANINPAVLWESSGIRGYDLSGSEQSMVTTLPYLREALRTQQPQVVVFDLHMFSAQNVPLSENQKRSNLTMMPLGINKLDALYAGVPASEWTGFLLPFEQFHSRWAELSKKDFSLRKWDRHADDLFLGYRKIDRIDPQEPASDRLKFHEDRYQTNYRTLNAIIDSAQQADARVLLLVGPSTQAHLQDAWIPRLKEDLARDHPDVCLIETPGYEDEMGIDYATDYYDLLHLNSVGAEKYSRWLGERIIETCDVDVRSDEHLDAPWRATLERYRDEQR